jgi:pimeloyl-ACP methyl ester carboxylesterase
VGRFLLVHGAWHGGWCFAQLQSELERRGHLVEAPDLPCDRVGLTQLDHARLLGPQPEAVVVGHSLGGLTIPFVEARVRVYLAALLPVERLSEEAFVDGFGGTVRDELGRSYWPDADTAFERLYPDCTRAQSDAAFARLRPQAPIEPIVRPGSERDVVVATLRDACIAPEWQLRAGAAHAGRVVTIDAGHSPFFTHPAELADLLESVA